MKNLKKFYVLKSPEGDVIERKKMSRNEVDRAKVDWMGDIFWEEDDQANNPAIIEKFYNACKSGMSKYERTQLVTMLIKDHCISPAGINAMRDLFSDPNI